MFLKVQRNLSGQAHYHEPEKKGLQAVCVTTNNIWMSNMVSYISKETWKKPKMSHGKENANVKLKDRSPNTIIRQRTRETDIVQYVTNVKWKWTGHIAWMKDNRWTIRSTERQVKDVRSIGRPKCRWRDDIEGQQGAVWTRIAKDREIWRTLAEGFFLQWLDWA